MKWQTMLFLPLPCFNLLSSLYNQYFCVLNDLIQRRSVSR